LIIQAQVSFPDSHPASTGFYDKVIAVGVFEETGNNFR